MSPPLTPRKGPRGRPRKPVAAAFTILELLVAATVLLLMLGLVLSAISQTSTVTRRATSKISAFQDARAAFDLMSVNLGQATLHSYWDYVDSSGNFLDPAAGAGFRPDHYARRSELHFLIGEAGTGNFGGTPGTGQAIYFQAPLGGSDSLSGLDGLLDAVGYFITYEDADALPAPFSPTAPRYRYRLMQAVQPAEDLEVYQSTTGDSWTSEIPQSAVPLAENIIYLAAWPRKAPTEDPDGTALSGDYSYDSRAGVHNVVQPETANQMPPMVQVTIVAMDEASAARVCQDATPPAVITDAFSGLFETSDQNTYEANIRQLKGNLDAAKINYRIFTATIPIRESKMQ